MLLLYISPALTLSFRNDTHILAVTSEGRQEDVGKTLPLSLVFAGDRTLQLPIEQFNFTYRTSPRTDDIYPTTSVER